jgi:hypothetical protein
MEIEDVGRPLKILIKTGSLVPPTKTSYNLKLESDKIELSPKHRATKITPLKNPLINYLC